MLSQNPHKPVTLDAGNPRDLEKLIQEAKKGDPLAFETIYHRVYTPLYRYIYSRTKNKEHAEDISQNVFLRFYEALPRYEHREGEGSLLAYLFTIAKRIIINDGVKKTHVHMDDDMFEDVRDESIDIVSEAHIALLAEKIDEYLHVLSDDEQDVIRLFFYAELSHQEVALVLETNEAHVRKLKERALRKLRETTSHLYEQGN